MAAQPAMAPGTVSILAADRAPQSIEGRWHGDQTIILEFESVQAARDWYHSDEYQAAAKLRHAAADCNGVIVAGFEPPTG